jgi:hypothetical protein
MLQLLKLCVNTERRVFCVEKGPAAEATDATQT